MSGDEVPCRDTDPMPNAEGGGDAAAALADKHPPMAFTIDFDQGSKKLALKDGIRHFAPAKKAKERAKPSSPAPPALTEMRIIKETSSKKTLFVDEENNLTTAGGDQDSDAGTYTIGQEEAGVEVERRKIEDVFCVEQRGASSGEWVAQWASSSASSPAAADRETLSRSRRRLPATPASADQMSGPTSAATGDTEDALQDTLSVMAAMEARIEASPRLTPQEERKLAWERRKNYDPLKATGKKVTGSKDKVTQSNKAPVKAVVAAGEESCSDSCSEVELQKSPLPREAVTQKCKNLPATRQNRAFALRRKLNSLDEDKAISPIVSNGAVSRSEAARHSLRGAKTGIVNKQLTRKTLSDNRSTSSLSSKEAEFQAWKRRKNYNPLRSSGVGIGSGGGVRPKASPSSATSRPQPPQPSPRGGRENGPLAGASVVAGNGSQPMIRSASFHYPDGLSRVQHNAYSSEEESADDYASLQWHGSSRLFEVNEDEFILPIGAKARPSHPHRSAAASRSSPKRMEALDNLVISTIYSISTKLCLNSATLIKRAQDGATSEEQHSMMDTLVRLSPL